MGAPYVYPETGAPFQWAAIFHKEDLHFARGAEGLAFYNSQDKQTHHRLPCKVSCAYCHTPIMDEGRNMVLMFPGIIKVDDPEHKKWFDPQYVFSFLFFLFFLVDVLASPQPFCNNIRSEGS